ncbi:MAG: hypothetical protein ABSG02_19325 [Terriglobales bacterium]|jgi:hypothetical protein
MPDVEFVEFTVRLSEMRKAIKHLFFNRAEFKDTDSADLLVSECGATFRAVGTEFEVPVQGTRSGTVRLPLKELDGLMSTASTYKKREVQLRFEPGKFPIEAYVRRHPDISLGILPDRKIDLPPDAGVLDTLAMAQLLSPEEVVNQGFRERVEAAQRQTSDAVTTAFETLRDFGVQRGRIQELVDERIKETSERLGGVIHGQH